MWSSLYSLLKYNCPQFKDFKNSRNGPAKFWNDLIVQVMNNHWRWLNSLNSKGIQCIICFFFSKWPGVPKQLCSLLCHVSRWYKSVSEINIKEWLLLGSSITALVEKFLGYIFCIIHPPCFPFHPHLGSFALATHLHPHLGSHKLFISPPPLLKCQWIGCWHRMSRKGPGTEGNWVPACFPPHALSEAPFH